MGPRDVDQLTAHIDLLPTLVDLCRLRKPPGPPLDGVSLRRALYGNRHVLRNRVLFVHSQRVPRPQRWRRTAVMTDRWRLIDGRELYDIRRDPSQRHNLAARYPAVVRLLRAEYDKWWASLQGVFDRQVRIVIGSSQEPVTVLTAHDWHCSTVDQCPWNQTHIRQGRLGNGPWALEVQRAGEYEFRLRRWPPGVKGSLEAVQAVLEVGKHRLQQPVSSQQEEAVFRLALPAGPIMLRTELTLPGGKSRGAYYVVIRRVD